LFCAVLARARICARALSAHRQLFAVPYPAVATDVHKTLDVEAYVRAEVALHREFAINDFLILSSSSSEQSRTFLFLSILAFPHIFSDDGLPMPKI